MPLSRREFSLLLASSFAALRAAPSHAGPLRVRCDINSLSASEGVQLPFDAAASLFDVGGLMIGTTR